jgi:methylenetetrahydrofolate dehydrogenase (NADP+)/methenyltetrahydrofolate cyclohydrolase
MSSPLILNGIEAASHIRTLIKHDVETLSAQTGQVPGLAVILVGENPASQAYVGMKKKACAEAGIKSFDYAIHPSEGEEALLRCIRNLNQDPNVHGILLQLPLPKGFDEDKCLQLIDPAKDVDGFHPINVGKLLIGLPTFKSCTPFGVCRLLEHYKVPVSGKHVVIVGRSNIVGKPLAAMLMQKTEGAGNATVTVCHSQSQHLEDIMQRADILVAAIGKPGFVKAHMVKKGAVVIDVGINRIVDADGRSKIVGDVDFDDVFSKVSAITPVPGGIGKMTIAMLLSNTLDAFKAHTLRPM